MSDENSDYRAGQQDARIKALEKATFEQNAVVNSKLDKLLEGQYAAKASIDKAHLRIDNLEGEDGPIKSLQAEAADTKKFKFRTILAMLGISTAGGAGGHKIGIILDKLGFLTGG